MFTVLHIRRMMTADFILYSEYIDAQLLEERRRPKAELKPEKMIVRVGLQERKQYPVERIKHHIMSISRRIEASIADNVRNNFNFWLCFVDMQVHMRTPAEPVRSKNVSGIPVYGCALNRHNLTIWSFVSGVGRFACLLCDLLGLVSCILLFAVVVVAVTLVASWHSWSLWRSHHISV